MKLLVLDGNSLLNRAFFGIRLLATGDRDSLQLVDDNTTVLLATNKETLVMDPAAIREKYGLALVQKFGSLEGVYEHLDDKAIKPKQREKLAASRDMADLSHMLGPVRRHGGRCLVRCAGRYRVCAG